MLGLEEDLWALEVNMSRLQILPLPLIIALGLSIFICRRNRDAGQLLFSLPNLDPEGCWGREQVPFLKSYLPHGH